MTDYSNLPEWQSHKVVRAAEITGIGYADEMPPTTHIAKLTLTWKVDGREMTRVIMEPDPKLFARYIPVLGDYYVEYDNDYAAISPMSVFVDGYARIAADG